MSLCELAHPFVEDDAGGGGEIEAPSGDLRDGDAVVRIGLKKALGKAARLASEDEIVSTREGDVPVGTVRFCREKMDAGALGNRGMEVLVVVPDEGDSSSQ